VGFSSGIYPQASHALLIDNSHLSIARWVFFFLSLFLCIVGVASIRKSEEKLLTDARGVSPKAWLLAAGLGTIAILFFVVLAKTFLKGRLNPTLRTTELMSVVPFVLAGLAIVLQGIWKRLIAWRRPVTNGRFLAGDQSLVLALVVVPFALLAALSLLKPTFNARGMLLLGPYVLLVLAWGIARVGRNRIAGAFLLIALSAAHFMAWKDYQHMSAGRADYKALAAAVAPHIDKGDLVFIQTSWYATPIFYYLNSGWDRFVGQGYEAACLRNPRARVWTLLFYNYEQKLPPEMEEALANYQILQTVETPDARAVLYSPKDF